MLAVDPATGRTLLAWTRDLPVAPKPDHVRELVDRLAMVRAGRSRPHPHQPDPPRPAARTRAGGTTVVAPRDRTLHAAPTPRHPGRGAALPGEAIDRRRARHGRSLIGASFTRGKNARERTYTATSRDVGPAHAPAPRHDRSGRGRGARRRRRAQRDRRAVGLDRLIHAKPDAAAIADLAEEDPLVRAADRMAPSGSSRRSF